MKDGPRRCPLAGRGRCARPGAITLARQVAAALAAAARQGLGGAAADPVTGQAVDAPALRSRLLDHVHPALSDPGDTETITRLLHRLDQRGTGADRQRALLFRVARSRYGTRRKPSERPPDVILSNSRWVREFADGAR